MSKVTELCSGRTKTSIQVFCCPGLFCPSDGLMLACSRCHRVQRSESVTAENKLCYLKEAGAPSPILRLPTFLRRSVFWAPPSRMLVSLSTSKDCWCLSLSMSGFTFLLQVSPIDTRCTGLPILACICLVLRRDGGFP